MIGIRYILVLMIFSSTLLFSQSSRIKWKPSAKKVDTPLQLFHSTHVINFSTSETLRKGEWEFEISHRFIPRIKDGSKALFGFDGPVNMRIALGYAPTNNMVVTLGRSNIDDNYDLQIKYKVLEVYSNSFPVSIAVNAGTALNTEVQQRDTWDSKNFQVFGQIITNTMISKVLGIGIVPTYLYNSHIYCAETQYTFSVGAYTQLYLNDMWSLAIETNSTVSGWRSGHNSVSLGVDMETGGHFFKVFVTNNISLNTSQFIEGAVDSFNEGDLHIGFMITRLL